MPNLLRLAIAIAALLGDGPATKPASPARLDGERLMGHVKTLASEDFEGRATATPGSAKARTYLVARLKELGIAPVASGYEQAFALPDRRGGAASAPGNAKNAGGKASSAPASAKEGTNVVARIAGTAKKDRAIVLSAHYDHLGASRGQVFHGADDNASGTGALLEIGRYLAKHPPRHTVLLAFFDAEERGLLGARAFVASPPVPKETIVANVNLDMVGRNDAGELWCAGTAHYPQLRPLVERVAATAPVALRIGHDGPGGKPGDDWTSASDHGAFHRAGIPFLYFGVEDHADYHRPTDEAARLQPDFYRRAAETVLSAILELDASAPK